MTRKPLTLTLTAALLAAAAALPAAATADRNELRGAPTLRVVDDDRVRLQITTDERIDRRKGSRRLLARITVGGRPVHRLRPDGRHGRDFVYVGLVRGDGMEVGRKYTVRIKLRGQDTITRKAKLHPERERRR